MEARHQCTVCTNDTSADPGLYFLQTRAEQEAEERRQVEARYQDVLELLQSEGGRIASLQVGCPVCAMCCASLSTAL